MRRQSDFSDINYLHKEEVLPGMSPQLHLDEGNLLPIGSMSLGDRHPDCRDNIHWDSLAQLWFGLYKQRSPSANPLGYTKLLNLTACSHHKKSPAA